MTHSAVGATDTLQGYSTAGANNDLISELMECLRETISDSRTAAGMKIVFECILIRESSASILTAFAGP